jgi:branched-subunit amino acid ABC-type transport system permease component
MVVSPELIMGGLVSGIIIGSLYGLAALGLSIIWGVLKVVNLSHGALIALSMYLVYTLSVMYGVPLPVALLASILTGFLLGIAAYYLFVHRVLGGPELASLLSTFGFGLIILGILELAFGGIARTIPVSQHVIEVGHAPIMLVQIIGAIIAVAVAVGAYLLLYRTWFGRAVRAVVMNAEASALMGVNVVRVLALSFTLGVLFAVTAGSLLSLAYSFTPETGTKYELYSFTIVVLGGLGNPLGSLVGGIILGIAEQLTSVIVSGSWGPLVAFLILLVMLIVRPTGLFAKL